MITVEEDERHQRTRQFLSRLIEPVWPSDLSDLEVAARCLIHCFRAEDAEGLERALADLEDALPHR